MIEKEFKALLTEIQYKALISKFSVHQNINQINFYFSDSNNLIADLNTTVRIRAIENELFLQIKLPITEERSVHIMQEYEKKVSIIPNTITGKEINELCSVDYLPDVHLIGFLFTYRVIHNWSNECKICLDHNYYLDTTDYEVEIEFDDIIDDKILDILNKLYNNSKYEQKVYKENKDKYPLYNPRIIIADDISKEIDDNLKQYSDTLVLYLFNRERFLEIGSVSLWNEYNHLEQYSFGKKYSVVNVLTDTSEDNPDEMMKFLFRICEMKDYWTKMQYGNILHHCKKYKKIFNTGVNSILVHADKVRIKDLWMHAFDIINDTTKSVGEIIKYLFDNHMIIESCLEKINPNHDYDKILEVPIFEVRSLYNYLKEPHISTQHGVKGESHDTVVFVATDSYNTPIAYMYKFFEVWSTTNFSLNEFESFYYSYAKYVSEIQKVIGVKSTALNKELHNEHKSEFIEYSQKILNEYRDNKIFNKIAAVIYETYLEKQTVENAKKCFKDSTVYGVLSAYRLFYVGCSRARKNLTIIVDKSKVSSFISEFTQKANAVGFDVMQSKEEKV